MLTNAVDCTIERRLLVNYRIDPAAVMRQLPSHFRPQLVSGWAVGGVCFIRLGGLRPAHFPSVVGMKTENVAHRFAVEWDDDQGTQVGVFIPRRDTNSRITALAGDRLFPGLHHLARFTVQEHGADIRIGVASRDGTLGLSVAAHETTSLGGELFDSLEDAVAFFRRGSLGYSASDVTDRFMGVRLESQRWDARPVTVEHMASTMFDNTSVFPKGSCTFDFGIVMRNLTARWQNQGTLHTHSERSAVTPIYR
jgi:hypothetical protein